MSRIRRCILTATVTAAALALPVPRAGAADDYLVRPGDSLYVIANRLDVTLGALMRANGLSLTSVIVPGQRLTVPVVVGRHRTSGGTGAGYTVVSGDWLGRIASRHGVSLSALLAANGLTATSVIQPGQRLTIPEPRRSRGGSAPPSTAGTYTVVSGDWLGRIASRHGVSLSALLAANGLTATSLIQPGQRLTIPARGRRAAAPRRTAVARAGRPDAATPSPPATPWARSRHARACRSPPS